jgi:hypothetical protein
LACDLLHLRDNQSINREGYTMQPNLVRRRLLGSAATVSAVGSLVTPHALLAQESNGPQFVRVPVQYIAALATPDAREGDNAGQWGLWRLDPGPRGVQLDAFARLQTNQGQAPAGWQFEDRDWWLEEHGLIMEAPEFPMPPGHYLVTGGREKAATLTVNRPDSQGLQHWTLDNDANIHDVTHLRCRSGRYTPADANTACSPAQARQSDFPVAPGADMPDVAGCDRQDYAVLIVYAVAELQA